VQFSAAIGQEPSDVDGRQTEEEKTLNWEADEENKRRDQQRVVDLYRDLPKSLCSEQ